MAIPIPGVVGPACAQPPSPGAPIHPAWRAWAHVPVVSVFNDVNTAAVGRIRSRVDPSPFSPDHQVGPCMAAPSGSPSDGASLCWHGAVDRARRSELSRRRLALMAPPPVSGRHLRYPTCASARIRRPSARPLSSWLRRSARHVGRRRLLSAGEWYSAPVAGSGLPVRQPRPRQGGSLSHPLRGRHERHTGGARRGLVANDASRGRLVLLVGTKTGKKRSELDHPDPRSRTVHIDVTRRRSPSLPFALRRGRRQLRFRPAEALAPRLVPPPARAGLASAGTMARASGPLGLASARPILP